MVAEGLEEVEILGNAAVGGNARILSFRRGFSFIPGQVVGITTSGDLPPRWYSLSSSAGSPLAEVLYTRVDDGLLTPKLWTLRRGDRILCSRPRGAFLKPASRTQWWFANGSGLAPFVSMLRTAMDGDAAADALAEVVVIHGVRRMEDAYYADVLATSCARLGCSALHCVSDAAPEGDAPDAALTAVSPPPGVLHFHAGRLTAWLRSLPAGALPAEAEILLCGSAGMIAEVRDLVLARGVAHERILAEVYF